MTNPRRDPPQGDEMARIGQTTRQNGADSEVAACFFHSALGGRIALGWVSRRLISASE